MYLHTDDSGVTLNVCLGKDGFEAAGLTFCGDMGAPSREALSNCHHLEQLLPP